jgi:hypothetical protein
MKTTRYEGFKHAMIDRYMLLVHQYVVAYLKMLADNNTKFSSSTVNSLSYPLETLSHMK